MKRLELERDYEEKVAVSKVVDEFASDDLPSLEELFILDKNIQLYLDPN